MSYRIIVTDHACDRLRERSGLNKKSVTRLAERAYYKGLKHSETSGSAYKYISSVASNSNKGTVIRIYGDKIFIFNKSDKDNKVMHDENGDTVIVLVTVLQIPNNIIKKINDRSKKVKK